MAIGLKNLTEQEYIAPGRSGCPGCAAMLVARLSVKVMGQRTIMVCATGCVLSNFTHAGAPGIPFIHSLLPGTGSLLSGIDAGLKALGKREGINLLGFAGDGGTADIGLQSLSGAVERRHRFVYICYDNEGYMNTGGQRSGTTPFGAGTATTPVGAAQRGEPRGGEGRKDMVLIMAAHGIPYAATASLAYPQDFLQKVQKAAQVDGPAYIHVLTPCNYRWGFAESLSVKVARLAVQTRVAPLLEIEDGRKYKLGLKNLSKRPVREYLEAQGRFRHLTDEEVDRAQTAVDAKWEYLQRLAEAN